MNDDEDGRDTPGGFLLLAGDVHLILLKGG
jgi:hypothetical protein